MKMISVHFFIANLLIYLKMKKVIGILHWKITVKLLE